jgi:hypothetical protein
MNVKLSKAPLIIISFVLLTAAVAAGGHAAPRAAADPSRLETRCGWFSNPTPANIWLYDREGEWTLGVQGGYQVEGDWDWPNFKPGQWVETNGHYGYGCACFQLRVNKETHQVSEVKSARARPLSVCRRDRALKKWNKMLE